MRAFVVRLDDDLWEKFTIKCVKERESKNKVIENFIKNYVKS